MNAPIKVHTWRKSSFSASDSDCVEVAVAEEVVGVRDSKNQGGPLLSVTRASWTRLLDLTSS